MRIAINARTTIGRKTGVGVYTANLLRYLPQLLEPNSLFVHPPHRWMKNLFKTWYQVAAHRDSGRPPSATSGKPGLKTRLLDALVPAGRLLLWAYDRSVLRKGRFDLYHEPNYIPVPCDVPTATTIHDLSIVHHPEWHPLRRVKMFDTGLPRAIRQSVHIFTDTEFSRREIAEHFHLPLERITNTSCGVRSDLGPMPEAEYRPILDRLGVPKRYLLHVGTIEPRKNLLNLMRAYVALPTELRSQYPLILVGQWGWRYEETAAYYSSTAMHHGVRQIGYLPDEALAAVYNGATALLFPTLYEGFGIPPLEMMACGGAVIASTAGAVMEVLGRHAVYVDPQDIVGWRNAIQRLLTDVEWRQSLRRGVIEHARKYTWERTAADTVAVYRRLLGQPQVLPFAPAAQAA